MPRSFLPPLLALLAFASPADGAQAPAAAPEVTIYRCVGANGAVALRDSPCPKGEQQEVRAMQRPRDPPPPAVRPAPVAPPAAPAAPAPAPQVVYLTPPRPMYECTTPEGDTYTSDNDDGNPRWVPYWAGNPVLHHGSGYGASASVSGNLSIGNGTLSFQSGDRRPPRPPHGHGGGWAPGGVWIRDACHALPQQEVCARLSDRRYEILRRYGSAMPSERRALDLEQRGIDARIANDCNRP